MTSQNRPSDSLLQESGNNAFKFKDGQSEVTSNIENSMLQDSKINFNFGLFEDEDRIDIAGTSEAMTNQSNLRKMLD